VPHYLLRDVSSVKRWTLLFVLSVSCTHLDTPLDASGGGIILLSPDLSSMIWSRLPLFVWPVGLPPSLGHPLSAWKGGIRGSVRSSSSSSVSSESLLYASESLSTISSISSLLHHCSFVSLYVLSCFAMQFC
jgi:hypothetical protein